MQNSSSRPLRRLWLPIALLFFALCSRVGQAADEEPIPIRVPDGFEVTPFAGDDLAHDIYSMTLDSFGRVVVSGAGYVRILIDTDNDGRADKVQQYADGPTTGSQGMFFFGRDLLCTGDAGLIRYRDRDGDDRADGPPDVFLKLRSGGEHHSHSVQKGPDGWWYIIAGNEGQIAASYATLPTSPIKQPRAGALLRLKPDLSGGEIVADGFRNAYDFAFGSHGDIFTYDSDDERDVSLPWYRPTRVFHVVPSTHAGWVSKSWKRPDYFPDMPPVVAEFGRGSPTGVVCYQHKQFPEAYDGAIIALDWTFGRVMALPLKEQGGTWASKPIEFMKGTDQFGFAPTDAEVAPDGSLYVSVGGRGTRGSVFKVTYKAGVAAGEEATTLLANPGEEKLAACLDAPQPLCSWSRAKWQPIATELGRDAFAKAVADTKLSDRRRARAIEILVEMFDGLDNGLMQPVNADSSSLVRSTGAWAVGRTDPAVQHAEVRRALLGDADAGVRCLALESLLGAAPDADLSPLIPSLVKCLGDAENRTVRQDASRVVARLSPASQKAVIAAAAHSGKTASLYAALGVVSRTESHDRQGLALGLKILTDDSPTTLKLDAARLMQLSLGDVGPRAKRAAAVDGYAPRLELASLERELDAYRIPLAKMYPTGEVLLDQEISRLLAMLAPSNRKLLDRVLAKITEESHPVDDIHQLLVAGCLPEEFDSGQRKAVAKALVAIDGKIHDRHLNQDTNWDDRFTELYQALIEHDELLPEAIAAEPGFGRPAHVLFMSQFPKELLPPAIAAFVRNIEATDEFPWANDIIFVLGESENPKHRKMVRDQYDNFAVQNAVIMVLAGHPEPGDLEKFVHGLESSQLEVLSACLDALPKLSETQSASEVCALIRLLRRLSDDKQEAMLREKVVKLLERTTGQKVGEILTADSPSPQTAFLEKCATWVKKNYPLDADKLLGEASDETETLHKQLAGVDWAIGDVERGRKLFEKQACARCHGGSRALGPDLAGAARRFSRDDLFTAIALPNRDVSPRYHTTTVQTKDGKIQTGLIVYESVDGVILRNASGQTFRFEGADIDVRRKQPTSIMPTGLLKDLQASDLADLYAYLAGLGAETPKTATAEANTPTRDKESGSQ